MRPDLTLFDMPGPYRKIILDISNICPIPIYGSQSLNRSEASRAYRAAQIRYDERMNKFDLISKANGIKFHPIIFETTGSTHPDSLKFLQSILSNFSGYRDGKLLKLYWLDGISCSFQQHLSTLIIDKLRKQKGNRFVNGNFENDPEFILSSSLNSLFLSNLSN